VADRTILDMFRLDGRVAIVTGASSGLGAVFARALAEAGADVALGARRADRLVDTQRAVEAAGRRAIAVRTDVSVPEDCQALVDATMAEFGRVDVLVNNAGMSPLYDRVEDVSEDLWRKVIDVNLSGPFRLTANVGARMAAGDGGSIINVSSVAARYPLPEVIPYAAAKAGLDALTVGFAHAFGPTVRVNSVQPGTFLTDVSKHWDMDAFERESQGFALQRGASADELEGTMLYLASDASTYTTGAVLRVDGGYLPPQRSGRS
jgi:NAD(P)-dependent dehydrogenase (short-subunit alcohol dehydrogenase family)